jgi:hypothetical protein
VALVAEARRRLQLLVGPPSFSLPVTGRGIGVCANRGAQCECHCDHYSLHIGLPQKSWSFDDADAEAVHFGSLSFW